MLKFFRKIRQRFISENKLRQYLIYALGEIVLVVIGILIALWINNLNQNRINSNMEQVYLQGLRDEFQTSQVKLEELIKVNRENYSNARKILEYTRHKTTPPSEEEFSILLYKSLAFDIAFNPNNSLLNEMINSGTLKNISSAPLRIRLTNWLATLEDIRRQEGDQDVQREKILDLAGRGENSLQTILENAGVVESLGLPKAKGKISNLNLLESIEFENLVLSFILTSYSTEEAHYIPLLNDLEMILNLIHEEIEES